MMNRIALSPNSMIGVPALEYIDALAKAGYDGIGLRTYASPGVNYESVTQPITGNPAVMRDIKHALDDSGLEPVDALSYYIRPNFDLNHMMPSLEFVAELGFPYALAICDDPEWNRQVDNFGKLCDACRDLRLMVSMEAPVTQNHVNTLPKALNVINESGKDNAVICLDPMHFWRVGHQPSMLRDEDPKLFPYTQFRDGSPNSGPGARPEAGPAGEQPGMGQGHVPLGEILDNLPRGLLLSIEWGRPRGSDITPHQWAQHALDGTKKVVERYYAEKETAASR
ncbi:MAG TPA: sugar phosphate isomerase/epimerase [Chloroflexota bacterium]|nr:sugar phosphate isomerase/epimerase [Chloroflexota bacterium]